MDMLALWIVAGVGTATLLGVFYRMQGGFGQMNLRAVGIILIAMLASILAVAKSDDISAALGILGAIAGYLFGSRASESAASSRAELNASGANLGTAAKIAGRDINETINNLQAKVENLSELLQGQSTTLSRFVQTNQKAPGKQQYLINTVFQKRDPDVYQAIGNIIGHWSRQGYALIGVTENYNQSDALILIFSRPLYESEEEGGEVILYQGLQRDYQGSVSN
ncbi:MAG: hypothetical protein ACRERW_02855 [Pseudomonas sp.]